MQLSFDQCFSSQNDDRPNINLNAFGFLAGGELTLNVTHFNGPSLHSNKAVNETVSNTTLEILLWSITMYNTRALNHSCMFVSSLYGSYM